MEKFSLHMLEYESIKQELMSYAVSYEGRNRIAELTPLEEKRLIERAIAETAEALALYGKGASVPLPSLDGIELVASLLGTGYLFTEQDLTAVQTFLHSCGQLKKYMASKGELAWQIGVYAHDLRDLPALQQEILRCIRHGVITNEASRELEKVRKRIAVVKERIQKKLQSVMARHAAILQENIVSVRGGRYVIPVRKDYYKQVNGRMLDQSTSGQTVFIEPQEVSALQSELELLQGEEAREEAKVLGYLAELVEREAEAIYRNIEITGTYDFIFAKAKYAAAIGGRAVEICEDGYTVIREAKHPKLLQAMVPLDVEIGRSYRTLIITGPNTGGKTVVLKTFGLLALMVQSGLLVPVAPGSRFAVYRGIMAVIGDGQNLEQSLSTFSAQISALVTMLREAGPSTLLLIDELAAGTDPGEGIALSIAILEEFARKGATVLVTTHFNELKTFASRAQGFQNARMEFDAETLRPLYRLTIGQAGRSYALEIASRLGIAPGIVERSQHIVSRQAAEGTGGSVLWDDILPEPVPPPEQELAHGMEQGSATWSMQTPAQELALDLAQRPVRPVSPPEPPQPMRADAVKAAGPRGAAAGAEPGPASPGDASPGQAASEPGPEQAGPDKSGLQGQPELASSDPEQPAKKKPQAFEVGDAVIVTSIGKVGIVSAPQDNRGIVEVLVQKQRIKVNHKRLKPYIKKEELYPDDYDFDIVFDTKENRKKRKLMGKRHVEGLEIVRRPGEN
ncbi:endonuclease MutS2 [Paenibacillus macerans]|uniref:MutS domain V family protein n=1 Tax=Paenibacillus macerans TaxID=44252 RepID=A0A090Z731_PAEMA|nr:DNA mismatch repair protein MutS [Paenibacillus macerans]KFN06462.1 mutS domain V family protein [Paenibacillus macerans]MEC0150653.1 DNA mismatch repair protein MutS [Paenibacillus macerans]SUA85777.1 DNA mismatch repair protein MutS domain-containing protein [Paenibacillus macerans]